MIMNWLLVLEVLLSVTTLQGKQVAEGDLSQWELFKIENLKVYESEWEEYTRRKIFLENLNFVRKHNNKYLRGLVTFDVAMNKYADMTLGEFAVTMNSIRRPPSRPTGGVVFQPPLVDGLPRSVDWRTQGAVTPVKDQGHCSSCWAFSATGSLEGHNYIKTKKLVSLSEQNLIDCSRPEGNQGCDGGLMDQAFQYVVDNGGLDTETSYPYEDKDGDCHYNASNKGATNRGYITIPSGDEEKLQAAVALRGPVSVAIDSSYRSFQFYKSRVYVEEACSTDDVDHGVLVVGYGNVSRGGSYWLIKNSWGTGWGMKGYMMLAKDYSNMCGVATLASFPKI